MGIRMAVNAEEFPWWGQWGQPADEAEAPEAEAPKAEVGEDSSHVRSEGEVAAMASFLDKMDGLLDGVEIEEEERHVVELELHEGSDKDRNGGVDVLDGGGEPEH